MTGAGTRRGGPGAAALLTGRVLLAITLLLGGAAVAGPAGSAAAAPGDGAASRDDEGGTQQLRKSLDTATKGYLAAKARLAASRQRQRTADGALAQVTAQLSEQRAALSEMVGLAYRTGRLGSLSALLDGASPDGFLDRATTLAAVATHQDQQVRALASSQERASGAKAAVDREVREQQRQLDIMDIRRRQAQQALDDFNAQAQAQRRAAGGSTGSDTGDAASSGTGSSGSDSDGAGSSSGGSSSGGSDNGAGSGNGSGSDGGGAQPAEPADRNADGTFPPQSCSVDDPTTSGCLTPRTKHALDQARAAGFTRFVSCFRSGGSGEHPKGRACDFSAQSNGFGGVATGAARAYGDDLAAYFIANADRLGVLYVIWFRRIWLPGSGWQAYHGGNGDPSSDHTNHVHLSVN